MPNSLEQYYGFNLSDGHQIVQFFLRRQPQNESKRILSENHCPASKTCSWLTIPAKGKYPYVVSDERAARRLKKREEVFMDPSRFFISALLLRLRLLATSWMVRKESLRQAKAGATGMRKVAQCSAMRAIWEKEDFLIFPSGQSLF